MRRLARDLASFAHREDLRDEWDEAARRLPPIIAAVAAGVGQGARRRGLLARGRRVARGCIAAYQREDTRPVAAILRRPLVLLADELAGPPA